MIKDYIPLLCFFYNVLAIVYTKSLYDLILFLSHFVKVTFIKYKHFAHYYPYYILITAHCLVYCIILEIISTAVYHAERLEFLEGNSPEFLVM